MIIDTHAHLDFPEFAADLAEVIDRARAADVSRIITISTSLESCDRATALANTWPNVFAAVGVHPSNATEAPENFCESLRLIAARRGVVAVGECGLDYHRLPSARLSDTEPRSGIRDGEDADRVEKARQAVVFQEQLSLAAELALPVIVHEREAWDDTLALLAPFTGQVRAVFHCFGKSLAHAEKVLAMGHFVSFTGIATFKNAREVQATAAALPAGSFMMETDCPFLAPVPYRGKRCEPAYTRDVVAHLAQLRGITLQQLAGETTKVAREFFRLEP